MTFRRFAILCLLAGASMSPLQAAELFITKETLTPATREAATALQSFRSLNRDDGAFFQALATDLTLARRLFGLIKANDRTGVQALFQEKFPGSTVRLVKFESDFIIETTRTRSTVAASVRRSLRSASSAVATISRACGLSGSRT